MRAAIRRCEKRGSTDRSLPRKGPWVTHLRAETGGRFGAHQFHEKNVGTLIYLTWFSGGLRIVDVADPFLPIEVGSFIPEPCGGFPSAQSNDVFVDERGLIYMVDRNCGLDILEFDGPA